jgi:hypothetical protein
MLTVVRDNDTSADLTARRRLLARAVAAVAAAPVRHVPAAFLTAVDGLFPELVRPTGRPRDAAAR